MDQSSPCAFFISEERRKKMRKQTDLAKVKQTARSLLFTDIHETEFSPVIVSHPFTDSGFVASPNANGEIGLLNITESDADQRRWREYMGKLIDGAKSAYEINNEESFHDYYSDVEISYAASKAHQKAAIQLRNREMVDRAELVLCCIERKSGGAYQTVLYAKKQNKQIINLAGGMTTFCE